MTDTNTLPTDAEIDALLRPFYESGEAAEMAKHDDRLTARAVLAKWGAPASASSESTEPNALQPETKYNLGWSAGWDAHARAHPPEKPVAVPAGATLHQQLLNMLGAKGHEDAARIIAGHHVRELAELAVPAGMGPAAEVLSSRPGNDTSTIDKAFPDGTKLYTAAQVQAMLAAAPQPPAQEQDARKPLTDKQVLSALASITHEAPSQLPLGWAKFARAIEAAHGIAAQQGGA